ncbi:MAG: response regulator transcription factor [Caldilineaceae bacterium]|nr:response regulator transcription factor [Caldilineaceae bacterium]
MLYEILVVEDDRLTRRSLALHLTQAGYTCQTASSVSAALALAADNRPNLLLLDIGLPEVDGLEGLRRFRQQHPQLPIIFLTGRRRELDQVLGLELGADDYITKPFDIDVLLARIKAVLRRSAATPNTRAVKPTAVVAGDLTVDPAAHVARLRDQPLDLAPKEFDLLLYLAQSAGTALSVQDILHHVWGEDWIGEEQTVYVHVRWLRTKLEDDPSKPQRLLTVRGAGYKLMAVNA